MRKFFFTAAALFYCVQIYASCPIKKSEELVFFPSYGYLSEDKGVWTIPIHGWLYEPERKSPARKALLALLIRRLSATPEDSETPAFQERIEPFMAESERGRVISIYIKNKAFRLKKSDANGHITDSIMLPADIINYNQENSTEQDNFVSFAAVPCDDDTRIFSGKIRLIGPKGLSVVSDIDDTLKVTGAGDKKALIENTFLKEFEAVPGMPVFFDKWKQKGAEFHYVSASPWQLFKPLDDFLNLNRFPPGTLHLRAFSWKNRDFFSLFESPVKFKTQVITELLERFPKRKFILVGDNGGKDPEIYANIARSYPGQILKIFIRDLTPEEPQDIRYKKAFKGLPTEIWKIFTNPSELEN